MSITVEVRGGNLEKAMRVLKKKVQKAGIIKDLRSKLCSKLSTLPSDFTSLILPSNKVATPAES